MKEGINMAEKVEVVIKIPKYYLTHPQDYSCLAECVRRGVPLPKGHGGLIDADDIDNHIIGHVDTRGCPIIIKADTESEDKE